MGGFPVSGVKSNTREGGDAVRIPTDKTLARWIRELARDGKLYAFYKTPEWLALRLSVMSDNHWECARCRAKSPALYTRAQTVHHEMEVKEHPELALSRTYRGADGEERPNLVPLCNRCHNEVHGRYCPVEKLKQLNEERW